MKTYRTFAEFIQNVKIKHYQRLLKKMSPIQRFRWADEHPALKELLGLRGLSELSILEKASLPIDKDNSKKSS